MLVIRNLLCGGGVRILADPARSYGGLICTLRREERAWDYEENTRGQKPVDSR